MEALHRHSPQFRHKRLAFLALLIVAIVSITATTATGSLVTGILGVCALAGALVMGAGVACHKGCGSPDDRSPSAML
jgi:hypothetical protein